MTTLPGDYEPSPSEWVRDQVAEYEASGGQRANTLLDTGMPIIVARDPLNCVAIGSGQCLEEFEALKQVLITSSQG